MKRIWNKIDEFLIKFSKWLLIAILVAIMWALSYKAIIGEYMMYIDYYDNKTK